MMVVVARVLSGSGQCDSDVVKVRVLKGTMMCEYVHYRFVYTVSSIAVPSSNRQII